MPKLAESQQMKRTPKTFYKFREFNTQTLDALCLDTIHFSNPGSFNDPLDCNPSIECDSHVEELKELLEYLIKRRVKAEVLKHIKESMVKLKDESETASRKANLRAKQTLNEIAYNATNPDYEDIYPFPELKILQFEIESELKKHFESGICCFSTSYTSPVLWSHYGDQHQGICIGYSTDRNPVPTLKRVVYGGNRSINTSLLYSAFIKKNTNAINQLERDVLLRKAKRWEYESEWRLIGTNGLQDSPLRLKDITFGLRCNDSIMHAVVKALANRDGQVNFFRMEINPGSFNLRRRPLDTSQFDHYLPRTSISAIEAFGPSEIEHDEL